MLVVSQRTAKSLESYRGMFPLGACLIACIRLARERQVNVRVVPTGKAIEESVDLAYEIFSRVFRKVPEWMQDKC